MLEQHLSAVPQVEIIGNGDVHANRGGKVVLRCLISGTLQKPAYVFWWDHGLGPDQ